ncbi:MAG TPA: hypothetical protein VGN63_16545 [Flavisolibacter sp.]|jgi:hypothetical protein|nr:hypothetical protein [Flavisolibacter sp.]
MVKRLIKQRERYDDVVLFKEKRKWQIALRRYVLEKHKSTAYAPYFGLSNEKFREWIETQFDEDLTWDNFSENWQFDHIVPVAYFDFTEEEDLKLCWNFINIRVAKTTQGHQKFTKVDVLGAKAYFEALYQETSLALCSTMVEKINHIVEAQIAASGLPSKFINQNKDYINALQQLSAGEYERLNTGTTLSSLLYEKEFLKKFGS